MADRNEMHMIRQELTTLNLRVGLVYDALKGNDLLKDGGIVGDIVDLKTEQKTINKRIDEYESKEKLRRVYTSILWVIAGFLSALFVQRLFK